MILLTRGALIGALVLHFCHLSLANPIEDLFGASARVRAMGGSGSVLAQDFSATYYNPANLSRCGKNVVTLGYDFVHDNLQVQDQQGAPLATNDPIGNHHVGNIGGCFLPISNLGVGVYLSAGMQIPLSLQLRSLTSTPQFALYSADLKSPSAMVGFGYSFFKMLSIGFGATFIADVSVQQDAIFPVGKGEFSVTLRQELTPRVGLVGGITFEPIAGLRGALTYKSVSRSSFNVLANIKTMAPNLEVPINFEMQDLFSYSPQQVTLGLMYQPAARIILAADATYSFWSFYNSPFILARAVEDATLTQIINFPPDESVGFHNVITPRVGAEFLLNDKSALRAGYLYRMSPARSPSGRSNVLDSDVHRVTFGAGYRPFTSERISLVADAFVAVDVMAWKNVNKSSGGELRNYSFGGNVINAGISLSAEY